MDKINFEVIKKEGEFDEMVREYFPEILVLNNFYEKNICHNETIYSHVRRVFLNINELLDGFNTRNFDRELLTYLAIYHDFGKVESFKTNIDGSTSCVDHEAISVSKLPKKVEETLGRSRFNTLTHLISSHSDLQNLLDNKIDCDTLINSYKDKNPTLFSNLVLFSIADLKDSYLTTTNKAEYDFRINKLIAWR